MRPLARLLLSIQEVIVFFILHDHNSPPDLVRQLPASVRLHNINCGEEPLLLPRPDQFLHNSKACVD